MSPLDPLSLSFDQFVYRFINLVDFLKGSTFYFFDPLCIFVDFVPEFDYFFYSTPWVSPSCFSVLKLLTSDVSPGVSVWFVGT